MKGKHYGWNEFRDNKFCYYIYRMLFRLTHLPKSRPDEILITHKLYAGIWQSKE